MKTANHIKFVVVCCALLFGGHGALAQDWPQWRGPNRDNKVTGFTPPKTWPKELTKKWSVNVGQGEASPVMVGNKIFVFGRQGGDEVTMCLEAATGKEVWMDTYTADPVTGSAKSHPGCRSTPAVAEGKVCTLGVAGVVSCLDAVSGKVVWRKETKSKPTFYTSTSPLIADGKCIVYTTALSAFDLTTGVPAWEWTGGGAPYGSPILMTVDGVKQVVTPSMGALAAIGLVDGQLLWEVKIGSGGKDYQSNYSTPIIQDRTVIYTSVPKPGKIGTIALKIEKKGDEFSATEVWNKEAAAHQYHTPVLREGILYGVSTGRTMFCWDAKTGDQGWADKTKRGECGHILDAGSVLLALSSDCELVVIEPNAKEYKEIAKYKVADRAGLDGPWSCPIVSGNRVYVKDKVTLTLWTID